MSRNLLILALLLSGTGCSVARPLLSTIVVTPPRLSFRQLPRGESWNWTAVAVTYPSESLTPAPCTPSPVRPAELVTFFEKDERPAPRSPSGPAPSVTTVVPVPLVNVPASAPSAIVHLENATCPQSAHLTVPSVTSQPLKITPIVQTAVAVTHPSKPLDPPACAPSPVRTVELAMFIEDDERPAPRSPSRPVPSVTTIVLVPQVNLPAPPVRVESIPPTDSNWKPVTRIALVTPTQTSTEMRCDQDDPTRPEVRQVMPVGSLSPPVLVQHDLSELLTEIRNQRQLIEALQRDLTRERSADYAAIDELEAAVENLLVQTRTAPLELPTTLRK